nr:MAG TPA: hypothetical protein [Caudoviricetes sp.]
MKKTIQLWSKKTKKIMSSNKVYRLWKHGL